MSQKACLFLVLFLKKIHCFHFLGETLISSSYVVYMLASKNINFNRAMIIVLTIHVSEINVFHHDRGTFYCLALAIIIVSKSRDA